MVIHVHGVAEQYDFAPDVILIAFKAWISAQCGIDADTMDTLPREAMCLLAMRAAGYDVVQLRAVLQLYEQLSTPLF